MSDIYETCVQFSGGPAVFSVSLFHDGEELKLKESDYEVVGNSINLSKTPVEFFLNNLKEPA